MFSLQVETMQLPPSVIDNISAHNLTIQGRILLHTAVFDIIKAIPVNLLDTQRNWIHIQWRGNPALGLFMRCSHTRIYDFYEYLHLLMGARLKFWLKTNLTMLLTRTSMNSRSSSSTSRWLGGVSCPMAMLFNFHQMVSCLMERWATVRKVYEL